MLSNLLKHNEEPQQAASNPLCSLEISSFLKPNTKPLFTKKESFFKKKLLKKANAIDSDVLKKMKSR